MVSKKLLFILLLPLSVYSKNPYDTSTPEKFVESMGLIGQQPKSNNPLPYFFEKKSAVAILKFDQIGEKGRASFDTFRNSIVDKFSDFVVNSDKESLKVALDGSTQMNIRSFSFGVTLIAAQFKERQPSDYKFISATEPDENNISQLTMEISGVEKTLPIKKTKKGYRMFLEEEAMENIYLMITKTERLEAVFSEANKLIAKGEITAANFKVKMEEVSKKYAQVLE